jgi:hypothetical protein
MLTPPNVVKKNYIQESSYLSCLEILLCRTNLLLRAKIHALISNSACDEVLTVINKA